MANLIVYYSRKGQNYWNGSIVDLKKGNTERVAEFIQKAVGGDLFEIETVREYSKDYMTCTEEAKVELREHARLLLLFAEAQFCRPLERSAPSAALCRVVQMRMRSSPLPRPSARESSPDRQSSPQPRARTVWPSSISRWQRWVMRRSPPMTAKRRGGEAVWLDSVMSGHSFRGKVTAAGEFRRVTGYAAEKKG